jgi:hypothetical protein
MMHRSYKQHIEFAEMWPEIEHLHPDSPIGESGICGIQMVKAPYSGIYGLRHSAVTSILQIVLPACEVTTITNLMTETARSTQLGLFLPITIRIEAFSALRHATTCSYRYIE